MSTTVERHSHQPSRPADAAPLPLQRRLSAGEVEQRFSRGRSKAVTVEVRRRAAPIRAWRAAEADLTQIPKQEARAPAKAGAPAPRQPFIRDAGAGARPNAVERATRMRAIEQAWKVERARQAELETETQRHAEAAAKQRAEELMRQAEAQREAEERATR